MYTGIGIVFVYIYNLTFFGAGLAIAGDLEKREMHGLVPVVHKKKLEVRFASSVSCCLDIYSRHHDFSPSQPPKKFPYSPL